MATAKRPPANSDPACRRLVENMMSIKSFVEIKESAAAPCYPSVFVAICALAVNSLSVCLSARLYVCNVLELRETGSK